MVSIEQVVFANLVAQEYKP